MRNIGQKMKNKIQINENIELFDLFIYLKKQKTLILADVHLGYEEMLNKQGILIPRHQFSETIKHLEEVLIRLPTHGHRPNGRMCH